MPERSTAIAAWLCIIAAQAAAQPLAARGEAGAVRVSMESALQPVVVNRMHAWTVTLLDTEGRPLPQAEIDVDGEVPGLHRHLPTAPRVTKNLGDGKYLVEGVKFDMAGTWRLRLDVRSAAVKDRASFDIVVK